MLRLPNILSISSLIPISISLLFILSISKVIYKVINSYLII